MSEICDKEIINWWYFEIKFRNLFKLFVFGLFFVFFVYVLCFIMF